MGKFDNILICSDWDGTLCSGNYIPDKNIEAIRYFQANGGKFTVCTGRYYTYIQAFEEKIKPNTCLISLNGACIIDLESRVTLYESLISPSAFELLDKLTEFDGDFISINFFERNAEEVLRVSTEEYRANKDELMKKSYYKVVLIASTPDAAIKGRDVVNSSDVDEIVAVRSWYTGLELISKENTKGLAVRRLKSFTGAKTLITVGDFENDISMLEAADISYAPRDTIPLVKSAAKRLTVSVNDGILANVISEIEKEMC